MSTPVGKPARGPNILDYAPRHVREGGGPRRADEDAPPPRRADDDEPLADTRPEDEQYDIPLAPEAPHDETGGDADRDDDGYVRRVPRFDGSGPGAQQRGPEKTEFDDDFAQLAALLESIRRGGDPVGPPKQTTPLRTVPPPPIEAAPDLYIDGLRVPPSLRPPFEPRPLPADGASYLKMAGGVAAACTLAAALAFVMVGGWHSAAPRPTAHLRDTPAHKNAAAVADRQVASDVQHAPRLASAPAPVRTAFAEPALNGPPAAAPQKIELAAAPPTAAPPAPTAPRAVPVVRVAPWPADTPSSAMSYAAPVPPPPVARAAPPPPPARAASLAQPPASPRPQPAIDTPQSAPQPQPAMDAPQIKLLLEQGKQFISVGDLVTARTVLRRVADADVAAGALALAETYDPAELAKLGVRGLQGDVDQARRWYERARELGSNDAAQRLALLASQ